MLMAEQNLKAPALAKILGTDRSNITRYLRGKRLPLYRGFVAIITHFNISADVMLGLVEYTNTTSFLPVKPFGKRLKQVMAESSVSQYELENNTDISSSSIYSWLYLNREPTVESLVKLSKYIGVSIDCLLGRID